jgi:hypothetical protein
MKPERTFPVSVKLWPHSDMYIWVPFCGFGGPQEFKSGGHLELQQTNWYQIMEHKWPIFKALGSSEP